MIYGLLNMYSRHRDRRTQGQAGDVTNTNIGLYILSSSFALKAKPGMWENTLLVFSSDNGGPAYVKKILV